MSQEVPERDPPLNHFIDFQYLILKICAASTPIPKKNNHMISWHFYCSINHVFYYRL